MALERGGERALLRFFKRRLMAAVPHRAYPANFSRLGLASLSGSEPRICRSCAARNCGCGASAGAGAGLSLRIAAAHGEGSAARRARGDLLAHSVAESGSIRHMSVATRTGEWAAGRGLDRIPDPGALRQFSG